MQEPKQAGQGRRRTVIIILNLACMPSLIGGGIFLALMIISIIPPFTLGFLFTVHVRLHAHVLRPGLTSLAPTTGPGPRPLQQRFTKIEKAIDHWLESTGSAA